MIFFLQVNKNQKGYYLGTTCQRPKDLAESVILHDVGCLSASGRQASDSIVT